MKLLRTIRLDPSDTFVFERAAEPGEWAVSGAFMFGDADPDMLTGKARARIVGLYRLSFRDADVVLDKTKGDPIYLILAMTPDGMLRMKPQNFLSGLPIRHLEAVS